MCLSGHMVWDDPSWSMMSDYPLRLGTLQKYSSVQIMVFPVVVTDKTDATEKRQIGHGMTDAQGQQKSKASWTELQVSFAVLPCPFVSQLSALVTLQKPTVNCFTRHTTTVHYPSLHRLLQLCILLLLSPRFINLRGHWEGRFLPFPFHV